jgi:allantoinase
MYDLLVTNARIVTEHEIMNGTIAVTAGKIVGILADAAGQKATTVFDAQGRYVLPGLIDTHVHFNQPGRDDWEGFVTGSQSAAAGGITTVIDMPLNNDPTVTDAAILVAKQHSVAASALIDYGLWGGLISDNVATMVAQKAAGALAFKAFMSNSGISDFVAVTDGVLLDGLREAARLGMLVAVHAESEALTQHLTNQLQSVGRADRAAWLEARPPYAELEAIQRALLLATAAHARLHVVHVSIAAGIDLVVAARRAGLQVTAETCPHYLTLDSDDFVAIGPAAKCAPPLRSRAEVELLWQRVLDGSVDLIGSDHSPCPTSAKRSGDNDIWQAWGGISGVQLLLPLLLTEGVQQRGLSLPRLVQLTASNPARLFGLDPTKGSLLPGSDADLTIVDLEHEWTVSAETLFARHKHSPYLGRKLTGAVVATFVRGQLIYGQQRFWVEPGYGCFQTAK